MHSTYLYYQKWRKVLFLIVFLIPIITSAQNSPFYFKKLNVNQGLSQNSVWSVCRDKQGFVWIGTADGLNRYNGYEVQIYKHKQNDRYSVGGNNIQFLYRDKYDKLWIGNEGGVDLYNPIKDNFTRIYTYPSKDETEHAITFLLEEKDKDFIWVQFGNKMVVKFSVKDTQKYQVVNFPQRFKHHKKVGYASVGSNQKFGFISSSGKELIKYDFHTGDWDVHYFPAKLSNRFFLLDTLVYYWEKEFLYSYSYTTRITRKCLHLTGLGQPTRIVKLKDQFVITSDRGYAIYDPVNNKANVFKSFLTDGIESYNRLTALLIDQDGMMWIGTDGRGLYYTSLKAAKFRIYRAYEDDANMIKGICSPNAVTIALAAYNKGIVVFDLADYTYHIITGPKALPGILNYQFGSICTQDSNRVWISNTESKNNGLILVNLKKGIGVNYSFLLHKHLGERKIGPYYTNMLMRNNKLYVIDANKIIEITSKGKSFESKKFYEIPNNNISCFYFSPNGKYLFVGSNTGTIVKRLDGKGSYRLAHNGIQVTKDINQDNNGNYYVATSNGIYIYDSVLKPIHYLHSDNGLADNFCYAILKDEAGNFWISHNKGISQYRVNLNQFVHYDVNDGLQSNEFNTGAFYKSRDGQMFFGGVNGTNAFYPKEVRSNPNKPKVNITFIRLFDEPMVTDTSYSMVQNINLPYNKNTVSFEFAAMEFSDVFNNTYQYQLEGYDNHWINSGNKHFARYANLPPGNFVFRVRAANADGIWNEESRDIRIQIIPPFWKTTWFSYLFVLTMFLLAVGMMYLIYARQQSKLIREREMQQNLERERMRISRDLHDNVGAQLSYLVTNIDWMRSHPDELSKEEEVKRLNLLEETGRQAILTLRQTIWAISHNELSVEEFADRFKQFAIKMCEFNSQIQLHFKEEIFENKNITPSVALHVFRICQEAFNNAVKHANASNLYVHFYATKESLFGFVLEDDGKGFNYTNTVFNGHYGLQNMKARAEENKIKLTISSELGKGTKVEIEL